MELSRWDRAVEWLYIWGINYLAVGFSVLIMILSMGILGRTLVYSKPVPVARR